MSADSAAGAPLTPEIVFENLQAFRRTAALKAAIELDIFGAVGQGLGDVASIARHAKASERGTRILCDFLVINGLLKKVDGRYQHTPSSAAFLDPASPHCLASMVRFMSLPELREPSEHLADIVRKGRTVLPGAGTVEAENPIWVEFAQSMAPMMAPMAAPLGAIVLEGRFDASAILLLSDDRREMNSIANEVRRRGHPVVVRPYPSRPPTLRLVPGKTEQVPPDQ